MGPGSWSDALSDLRKHTDLIDVDTRALELTLADLPIPDAKRTGIYILAAGELQAHDLPERSLKGTEFPLLWVDLPNLGTWEPLRTYRVQDEPVKVLRIAADGIDEELHPRQRESLRTALRDAMKNRPDDYEFDVFLSYAREDWNIVSEIHHRLTEAGITCWLDEVQMSPKSMVTGEINQGLRSSRSFLACISTNFMRSNWTQRELNAALHIDITRHGGGSVLVLMLREDDDAAIPPLLADAKRVYYTREHEFSRLIAHLSSLNT
ncbi:toll/interleukin-1 receptor domain-containing protein [Saccharopolyspora sp. NPDC050389]|uniref:toll/interleukin-1 receptor domain-containing protein n=1 Tax=Saccharopolyspora sp. NPDC050389 TaxID=3155516 RepID=UPI0033C7F358